MKMVLPDPPLITDYEDMYLLVVKAILTSQNKTKKKNGNFGKFENQEKVYY